MKSFDSLLCSFCPITYARADIPADELEILVRPIRGRFPYSVETGLAYTGKQRFIALHWDTLTWSIAASDGTRLVTTEPGDAHVPRFLTQGPLVRVLKQDPNKAILLDRNTRKGVLMPQGDADVFLRNRASKRACPVAAVLERVLKKSGQAA
ncbi:hypothetical protein [Ramlibacter alkalitolerans]|uniref:Uncharacterized protein n=1 Tax=Ramlibacter alkalitolerans TaxID=2039631 RepID=A0ABS1JW51_9BURK|nr:hypothetical protein [Ramlibacter alkalitolerans]MBL0427770.1 hypothetical protein [Ramlibacter alkalitolerans]